MPSAEPAKPSRAATGAIALAVTIAATLAAKWEGYVPKAQDDPAAIPTYCYGETENVDPLRVYSKDECGELLRKRLAQDYAPKLLECLPEIADRPNVFGALLDASYNAGWQAVCKSRMAVSIHAGKWREACEGLRGWFVTARNRKTGVRVTLKGLVNRRNDEANTCLS